LSAGLGERTLREALAWGVALAIVFVSLPLLRFASRDADSVLYAQLASRLSEERFGRWIAPEWPPRWYMEGLYREHPAGAFWPPALLARWGYPASQAAYAVNAGYQVLSLVALAALASSVVPSFEGRALAWLLQLLPIAFTFRVRANQEQAVLLFLVLAVLGTERARKNAVWGALVAFALAGLFLVKGVIGLLGPAVCAVWLLTRRDAPGGSRRAWGVLAAGVAFVGFTIAAYELAYRGATGQSFLSDYLTRQLGLAAAPHSAAFLGQKAYNLVWYLGRLLWFPFPFSVALLVAALPGKAQPEPAARGGFWFALAVAGLYLVLFSLSDRRADRYIFPAYYALGAAGAVVALRRWPWLRRLAERVDRRPFAPAALFGLLFVLHVAAGRLGLPTVKLWAPD
jgi:Dolichyl-phosphate-mannose-protein mannosyltransferase